MTSFQKTPLPYTRTRIVLSVEPDEKELIMRYRLSQQPVCTPNVAGPSGTSGTSDTSSAPAPAPEPAPAKRGRGRPRKSTAAPHVPVPTPPASSDDAIAVSDDDNHKDDNADDDGYFQIIDPSSEPTGLPTPKATSGRTPTRKAATATQQTSATPTRKSTRAAAQKQMQELAPTPARVTRAASQQAAQTSSSPPPANAQKHPRPESDSEEEIPLKRARGGGGRGRGGKRARMVQSPSLSVSPNRSRVEDSAPPSDPASPAPPAPPAQPRQRFQPIPEDVFYGTAAARSGRGGKAARGGARGGGAGRSRGRPSKAAEPRIAGGFDQSTANAANTNSEPAAETAPANLVPTTHARWRVASDEPAQLPPASPPAPSSERDELDATPTPRAQRRVSQTPLFMAGPPSSSPQVTPTRNPPDQLGLQPLVTPGGTEIKVEPVSSRMRNSPSPPESPIPPHPVRIQPLSPETAAANKDSTQSPIDLDRSTWHGKAPWSTAMDIQPLTYMADVVAQKRAQAEALAEKQRLEREKEQRSRDLQAALDREAEERRQRMFTTMRKSVGAPETRQVVNYKETRRRKEEAERKRKEEEERQRKEEEEREERARLQREEAERLEKEEAERKAKEVAERKAKEEAERMAREKAERLEKEEAERKAKAEAERKAKEEADRKAKVEAERKAKEAAALKAREAAEQRRAVEDAERQDMEDAERQATEEVESQAAQDAERRVTEDAAQQATEDAERQATEAPQAAKKTKKGRVAKRHWYRSGCPDGQRMKDSDPPPRNLTLDHLRGHANIMKRILGYLPLRDLLSFGATNHKYSHDVRRSFQNLALRETGGQLEVTTLAGSHLFSAPLDACVRGCPHRDGREVDTLAANLLKHIRLHYGFVTMTVIGSITPPAPGDPHPHLFRDIFEALGDRVTHQIHMADRSTDRRPTNVYGGLDLVLIGTSKFFAQGSLIPCDQAVNNVVYRIDGSENHMSHMSIPSHFNNLLLDFTHWRRPPPPPPLRPGDKPPHQHYYKSRLTNIFNYCAQAYKRGCSRVDVGGIDEVDRAWLDETLVPVPTQTPNGKREPHIHMKFQRLFKDFCSEQGITLPKNYIHMHCRGDAYLDKFPSVCKD